jgi:two-component system cell cycle sensor histidine kinase/response regulator CckA
MSIDGPHAVTGEAPDAALGDVVDDGELVRLAGRLARCGGWALEVPSMQIYWTSELFGLLGYEPDAGPPSYDAIIAMYPDGYREVMKSAVEQCMTEGMPMDLQSVIIHRDGRHMGVRAMGEAVRNDAGVIVRVQGAFYDISEIAIERERRIAAQETLRTTLDYIPDLVCFIDETWHVTFANQATVALAKIAPERLFSETIWTLFPDIANTTLGPVYQRAMTERVSGTARDFVPQHGIWVEVTVHPVEGGIAAFIRDVTDDEKRRQQMDEASVRAGERAALLDASSEAMIVEDLDHVVTYWNQGAEQIYGWTSDEAVGRNIRDLLYTDATACEEPAAALRRDGTWRGEMVQRTKDGRTVIIEGRWQSVLDRDGHPIKVFAVNSDVTEQRRRQLLQSRAQRMESLGTLAGGVAHDLNNVLTPLLLAVQLMRTQQPSPDHEALLTTMELGVTRGAEMIGHILSFARGIDGVRDVVDLAEVMRELSTMSLQTLPRSIEVTTHLDELPSIVGDKTQVLQVLMNLVANARDSMEDGGTLTLTVNQQVMTDADSPAAGLEPGAYAAVTVEDSGVGMGKEVFDRLFEPFFTTKGLGEGTGLGLPSCLAIVRSHGGAILAYSEVGVGSRFTVYFPVAGGEPLNAQSRRLEQPVKKGSGELVLVVDDEPSIRSLVSATLTAHGYRVVEAINGRDAIDVFSRHRDEVSLILTDMMMPVMDGAAMAAYFFEHHPNVAIVAASGLNATGGSARASNLGVRHFMSKPFTADVLLRTVHTALHE